MNEWKEKWQKAGEQADFYKSERNTRDFWNAAADEEDSGLPGNEHILLLEKFLTDKRLLDTSVTIMDAGCGHGDYTVHFADKCKSITAMDFSDDMLKRCMKSCSIKGLNNVNFLSADINEYVFTDKPDIILACLNPVTYQVHIFEKLLEAAGRCFVYFTMDTSLEGAEKEPVYRGSNSVQFAENYLNEYEYSYEKLKYDFKMKGKTEKEIIIPFAFLVILSKSK